MTTVKQLKEKKRTISEWEKIFDTLIMDYDGFPSDTKIYETLFTQKEFLDCVRTSTVLFSEKLINALNNY